MLDKNYAGTTASIIRSTFPNITAPKQTDLVSMLEQVGKDYQSGLQVRADNKLTDEMIAQNPEDEARIRQMGGRAYADMLKSDAQRAEERQWHLDDLESQRQFQKDLLRDKLNNDFALAKYKAQNVGYDPTAAERNVAAMVATGKYTPEQAWALQFAGGNPSFDVSQLGQKGFEAYDKASGERMAEKAEAMDLLGQTQSAYDDMFSKGGLVEKAQIGAGLPDTIAGRIGGAIDRAVPTTLVNSDAQKARQQIQYLMGGLRLNEASAMKGALSDSEQKFLSDMVAGNVKGYSPYEMQGAFEGIINKLKRKAGAPSLKQFNETPQYQEGMIAEDANGNRLIFRGGQWQQM